ncbi:MAG TPA: hypothetical protein VEY07_03615 [Thermoplasmata archaeon]|nr:hypothetical protein [Thermoplasmata archaeon]
MSAAPTSFATPYTPTPGSSTPSPEVSPDEGRRELWGFFWLSLANTAIITVAGLLAWWLAH